MGVPCAAPAVWQPEGHQGPQRLVPGGPVAGTDGAARQGAQHGCHGGTEAAGCWICPRQPGGLPCAQSQAVVFLVKLLCERLQGLEVSCMFQVQLTWYEAGVPVLPAEQRQRWLVHHMHWAFSALLSRCSPCKPSLASP